MARVTVEDCLTKVDNRFDLVMLASERARQLTKSGRMALVAEENDKTTVLALREIAEGYVDQTMLTDAKQAVTAETKLSQEDMAEIEKATTETVSEIPASQSDNSTTTIEE